MRFTEHELTVGLTGAAKTVYASSRPFRKQKVDVDTAWNAMDRYQRFQLLDGIGSQILPVLVALPDVDVEPGTRASYTPQQIQEVVESLVGDDVGRVRRALVVKARTALVQAALAHMPPRLDPDALIQP